MAKMMPNVARTSKSITRPMWNVWMICTAVPSGGIPSGIREIPVYSLDHIIIITKHYYSSHETNMRWGHSTL